MRSYNARSNRRWQGQASASGGSAALLAALLAAAPLTKATQAADGNEIPFDVANVFFELNNTDGDLGIHALVDGGPWTELEIATPDDREILQIGLASRLQQQGLTELFFESAEPPFDELAPETFFRRFPEGEYEVSGKTLDGEDLESLSVVTQLMPAPPNIFVNGEAVLEDCDVEVLVVSLPLTVSWDPVETSHPEIGSPRSDPGIEVVRYELVVEREEPTPLKFTAEVAPDVFAVDLPSDLAAPGDAFKAEVLVREVSGNQTATESCFEVE